MKWSIILFCILVFACEYEPQKEYYVDLNTDTFGNIAINLLDQPDTFNLMQETEFTYALSIEEGQLVRTTDIYVDDELIYSVGGKNGSFNLFPLDYATGIHHLRFDVKTTTGTGSLGDLSGVESLYYTREWVFTTDHTPPQSLEITKISEFNGKLKVEWTKNEHMNFQHYSIRRILYNSIDNLPQERVIAEFFDHDTNWFFDDSYVGGQVTYFIDNWAMNTTAQGIPKSFYGSYPVFLSKTNVGDRLTLTWNPVTFTGNFSHYEITSTFGGSYPTVLFSSDNVNDTIFTYSLPFGDSVDLSLNTVPEKLDYWYPETMTDRICVYAGDKVPRLYSGLVHSNDPDIIYLVDFNYIRRYNLKTGLTERTLETEYNDWQYQHVFVSPDGKYLVRASGNTAELLDPLTLAKIRTVDLSPFFKGSDELRFNALTNHGWLSVSMDVWPFVAGMVDMNTSDSVFTIKAYNWISIYPSPGDNYMVIDAGNSRSMYRYQDGLQKIHDMNQQDQIEFNSLNDEEIYIFSHDDNSINILSSSDLQVIKSCPVPVSLGMYDIDPVTGLIMLNTQENAYVLDIDQQKIVSSQALIFTSYSLQMYSFFNNSLFSGLGYRLSFNQ
jgi:hypothetical protein